MFTQVAATVAAALPGASATDRAALATRFAAGDAAGLPDLALQSFSSGYQAIMFSAACFAALSAFLAWLLVSPRETAPFPRRTALLPTDLAPIE